MCESLMYLMIGSCPDIGFAVVKLAQQMANSSNEHYQAGLHLCRYLLNTCKKYQIVYDRLSISTICMYVVTVKEPKGHTLRWFGSHPGRSVVDRSFEFFTWCLFETDINLSWDLEIMSQVNTSARVKQSHPTELDPLVGELMD